MVAVLLGFCKVPLEWWNSFATFFFLACSSARILFLFHLCCMQFFSSDKGLQETFFRNHPHPPSRVKWSAPKGPLLGAISEYPTTSFRLTCCARSRNIWMQIWAQQIFLGILPVLSHDQIAQEVMWLPFIDIFYCECYRFQYSQSSHQRPPLEFRKVVAARAGHSWEGALI